MSLMSTIVCCAREVIMKTGTIFSFHVILAEGSGHIYMLTGSQGIISIRWFLGQGSCLPRIFFTEVMLLACWNIWKIRNDMVFNNVRPRFATWKCKFVHDMSLHSHRFKEKLRDKILVWLANLA